MSRIALLSFLLVIILALPILAPVHAQTEVPPTATATPSPSPAPEPAAPVLISAEDLVPLVKIGMPQNEVMHGPYDSKRLRFGLPPAWELQPGAELYLHLSAFFTGSDGSTFIGANGGTLNVTFNNVLLTSLILDWVWEKEVRIPIPVEALTPSRNDGRHELYLFLNSAIDCNYDNQTSLTVFADTQFYFPHEIRPPLLDLGMLPLPVYQTDTFQVSSAAVVVPDAPSAAELEAAYTVIGALGRMTRYALIPPLLFASEVTSQTIQESHLLLVGYPAGLRAFDGANWPVVPETGRLHHPDMQADDGLIQITVSPANETLAWLMVSANNAVGLRKAAQAFSSGALRTSGRPDLALVADVENSVVVKQTAEDRTFGDLGYDVQSANGFGVHYFEFQFYLPPGMLASEESHVTLNFNHSAMMDLARSGMLVYLNEHIIGSARFTEQTARQGSEDFSLPRYALLPGVNRLIVAADLIPANFCSNLILSNLWITITPESNLHIPLQPVQFALVDFRDLNQYPYPFVSSPTLSSLGLVLPPDDPQTWKLGADLMAHFSRWSTGTILEFAVAVGDTLPAEFQERDLIFLGRPSQLPALQQVADRLPVPFPANSDIAAEQGMQISYRIPEGTSLGYLELFAPAWNEQRTVLGIFGSTPEGLTWALNALLDGALRGKLNGNFAVLNGDRLFTADTRVGIGSGNLAATAVNGLPLTPQVLSTPQAPIEASKKPVWIVPFVGATTLFAALLVLALIVGALRKNAGSPVFNGKLAQKRPKRANERIGNCDSHIRVD
ncbi:MAG: cellulose biosynthesis cyclic di-GMP-binding regulatory protein BcsB [Anaerolineales bacterium]